MSVNFVSKYMLSNGDPVYHVTGNDYTGKEASFILLVHKDKEDDFNKHINDPLINISNYGEILYSCYGRDISDQLEKYSLSSVGSEG